ncbi:hypothetical protein SMICM17S_12438 [Streptomyces microflavus]
MFAGQRVIVVGGGNSAIQIAAELGPLADTTLATRRPVAWTPQRPLGRDLHWWLKHTRLDTAPIRRLLAKVPVSVIDDGTYRAALDRHGVDRRAMFSRLPPRLRRHGVPAELLLEDADVEWAVTPPRFTAGQAARAC